MNNFRINQPFDMALRLVLALCASLFVHTTFANSGRYTPGNQVTYDKLFVFIHSATGFPFSMFPALGGADKTKWVDDELINREELRHTSMFLQGQIAIRAASDPASVVELEQLLQAANFLQKNFVRIATAFDAKGSAAISTEDIEIFFAQQKEKYRGNPN